MPMKGGDKRYEKSEWLDMRERERLVVVVEGASRLMELSRDILPTCKLFI
jgi:hypothetical protein